MHAMCTGAKVTIYIMLHNKVKYVREVSTHLKELMHVLSSNRFIGLLECQVKVRFFHSFGVNVHIPQPRGMPRNTLQIFRLDKRS